MGRIHRTLGRPRIIICAVSRPICQFRPGGKDRRLQTPFGSLRPDNDLERALIEDVLATLGKAFERQTGR
jgi:hypothetical protein